MLLNIYTVRVADESAFYAITAFLMMFSMILMVSPRKVYAVAVRGDQSNEDLDAVQRSQSDRRRISRKDNPEVLLDKDESVEDSDNEDPESEDVEGTESSRLIEEPEIHENLTTISQSYYIYPTTMLPRSRAVESALQPLLYIAEPFPSVNSICRRHFICCGGDGDTLKRKQRRRNELDLITGDIEMGINDKKGQGLVSSEMDALLDRQDDHRLLNNSASSHSHGRGRESQNVHRQDGMYLNHLPVFAKILMSSENVDSLPIAKLVESNIGLARVTQRTLRELDGGVENERLRRQWISMSSTTKNNDSKRTFKRLGREGENISTNANKVVTNKYNDVLYYNRMAAAGRSVSSVHELLNQLSVGPVLRLIDDPVIDLPCQPVIPEPSVAYGGRLGCWSEHSSNAERLGTHSMHACLCTHSFYVSLRLIILFIIVVLRDNLL